MTIHPRGISEKELRERVLHRCGELGFSQKQMLKKAGLAHDYIMNPPAQGRRVDRIFKLAEALDWSVAQLMGLELPLPRLDVKLVMIAYKMAANADPPFGEESVVMQACIYNALIERRAAGLSTDDEEFLNGIAAYCAEWSQLSREQR